MKNSLVAPALIAIFVGGILAKFSHLPTGQRANDPPSPDVYTGPFLPPCFISREDVVSPRAPRVARETRGLAWPSPLPRLVSVGMILLNLLLSSRHAVAYGPRRRCCLGTRRDTRHCSLYRGDLRYSSREPRIRPHCCPALNSLISTDSPQIRVFNVTNTVDTKTHVHPVSHRPFETELRNFV